MPRGFKAWVRPLWATMLAVMVGGWGCAPQAAPSGYEQLNNEIRAELQLVGLGVGDVFAVKVYGEKELSGEHQISAEGTVDIPLVGRIEVQGQTPSEIASRQTARIRQPLARNMRPPTRSTARPTTAPAMAETTK